MLPRIETWLSQALREIAAAIATAEIQAPLKRVRRRPWQNELCPAGFAMTDD
jgi:hypothetical protein